MLSKKLEKTAVSLVLTIILFGFLLSVKVPSFSLPSYLDIYTWKGGIGAYEFGGNYTRGEMTVIFAKAVESGIPASRKVVSFSIYAADGSKVTYGSSLTNTSGIAVFSFRISKDDQRVGLWKAFSTVLLCDHVYNDTMPFILSNSSEKFADIDIYTDKSGKGLNTDGGRIILVETIQIYAYVYFNYSPVPDKTVNIRMELLNSSFKIDVEVKTNEMGIAKVIFRTEFNNSYVGNWVAYGSVEMEATFVDKVTFEVYNPRGSSYSYFHPQLT